MILRRALLAPLFASMAALVLVAPVKANTQVSADCSVIGDVSADVSWIDTQVNAGYQTSPVLTCTGHVLHNGVSGGGIVTIPVTSNGSFTNIVCGTGSAGDSSPTSTAVDTLVAYTNGTVNSGMFASILNSTDLAYNVVFANQAGQFYWSSTPNSIPGTPRPPLPDLSTSGPYEPYGHGEIYISPHWGPGNGGIGPGGSGPPSPAPPAGPPTGLCTHGFSLTGDFSIHINAPNK
jgi:hypothetical protein